VSFGIKNVPAYETMNLFSALSLRNLDTGTREKAGVKQSWGASLPVLGSGKKRGGAMTMTMISAVIVQDQTLGAALGAIFMIIMLALTVLFCVGFWKVFTKAGQPGWAALIPFYNAYILTKIAGRPGWWVLMLMIPFVNLAFGILLAIDIAKAFGQGAAFGVVLLFLLSGVGYLVLGFGDYRYVGATELMPVTA
jgi:hypothetical protein